VIDLLNSRALLVYAVASNTALLAVPDVDSSFVVDRNLVQILSYFSILTSIGSIVVGLLLMRLVPPSFDIWLVLTGLLQALSLSGKETRLGDLRDADVNEVTGHCHRGRYVLGFDRFHSWSGETRDHLVLAIVCLHISASHSTHSTRLFECWPDVGHVCELEYSMTCWTKAEHFQQTFLASLSALFFRSTSLLTRLLTGGVEVVVVVFILWTIGHTWDEGEEKISRHLCRSGR
jgi:hypothetical protein